MVPGSLQARASRRDPASRQYTRRQAVEIMAGGAAACLTGRQWLYAAEPSRSGKFVEEQAGGVEIWQLTTEEYDQSNIYCEIPYCSKDSRYLVYARKNNSLKTNRTEFMVVELGTWKQERLDTGVSISGTAMSHDGRFYFLKQAKNGATDLVRADLATGEREVVHRLKDLKIRSLGTVPNHGRYYAGGTKTEPGWKMFDVGLIDLQSGEERILDRDPFILNPHPQFEPGEGRMLMIQHNRGGTYSQDGKLERLVGPEGATLYTLSVTKGKRTELLVGKPYTTPCTGHEAWIGTSQEMILSVAASGDFAPEKGNLLGIRPGQPHRVIARGYRFNHCGASRCGRYFWADDWQPPYKIVVGSTTEQKSAVVCASKTKPNRSQNSHPHPYVTPDGKWAIFNSNRTGYAHVYAARIPEGIIA
jgi:hypothetical protein